MSSDSETMKTQVAMVRGQVQDQADLQENTKRIMALQDQKITQLEEAVDVFDRYRRQINKKLLELQAELNQQPTTPIN